MFSETWTADRLSRASNQDLGSPQEIEQRFLQHLNASESCKTSLRVLLTSSSNTTRDFSLEVDAFDLLEADPCLGHLLLKYPQLMIGHLERAIVTAQQQLSAQLEAEARQNGIEFAGKVKGLRTSRVHARLVHLPPTCCKMSLAALQASDVGHIVQVSGTVVRATPVFMYESTRTFKCTGKTGCGQEFTVYADLEQRHNALAAPERCMASSGCKGHNFQTVAENTVHTDYQEATIQEAASQLGGGSHVPKSLLIKLQHDLVDRCQPGDEVVIVGLLLPQWQPSIMPNMECAVAMALRAHSIRVVRDNGASAWSRGALDDGNQLGEDIQEDKFRGEFKNFWEHFKDAPIAARDHICKAVCPKLYGMAVVKLALLLTLIGGVCEADDNSEEPTGVTDDSNPAEQHFEPEQFEIFRDSSGTNASTFYGETRPPGMRNSENRSGETVRTRRRGQSHLLLVGDPGTGKSQFLLFAAALCPRSVKTTGVGTTSAGLTCAAVRESGKEFSLEAGALVLADGGVCCIDEFGCIQDQDRTTIHEAMEQQTLSVAKAGIVCKLNCRASIVAVMNPKDCMYDHQAGLSRNTGLGTPLLSRFDVVFTLLDSTDAERDSKVTTTLLNRAIQGGETGNSAGDDTATAEKMWTVEKLRAYVSLVREQFRPTMSDEAAILLELHYEKSRSSQNTTMPVTVRFLESLIRLAQAHARLMFRKTVELDDAVAVVCIVECTAFGRETFAEHMDSGDHLYRDPMNVVFSDTPDSDFQQLKSIILQRYGIHDPRQM
ncbi:helicase MCM9 [Seminavis robusta]|uniref:Helicase MCM9 n=1 Tax=Seminavis robusta TaxID=568900 RepID=A0A9N8DYT6_9STRA|nr:helicase MCM9 [Seminavis robusta]|eukprot:Sro397_g134560.1 helicase MCM9 (774) ;mRNA; r:62733-65320